MSNNKLEYARDLLKGCLLPELTQDLDNTLIQSEQFAEFHKALEMQLPLLYDFLQQQEHWIFVKDATNDVLEVRACLVVLLCELTACQPEPVYKMSCDNLLRNAEKCLERHLQLEDAVEQVIFAHYQRKLQKSSWKRQLGDVHGFLRFLDFRYNAANPTGSRKMSHQWLTFCLSVGLCVRDCHEPTFKQIGTRIFLKMLHHGHMEDIQNLNIHSVIYDAAFKDVHFMGSIVTTEDILNCLYKCLDFYDGIDSLSWSYIDDIIEALLRNITLASNSLNSICMLKYIRRLCSYFTINREEIETMCDANLSEYSALEECRLVCAANLSYTGFRWAKSILNMFIAESYILLQSPNICRQFLQELHKCYMVCVLPIELSIIEPVLVMFYEKITAILMQVLVLQKQHPDIAQIVHSVIETFHLQLQRSSHCKESASLLKFQLAYGKLLQYLSPFVQNK